MADTELLGTDRPRTAGRVGVGGWLLWYCVSLTVLGPIASSIRLVSSYGTRAASLPRVRGQEIYLILDSAILAFVIAFGMYAGANLWRVRPRAVAIARKYQRFRLAYAGVTSSLGIAGELSLNGLGAFTGPSAQRLGVEVLFFLIWSTYLRRSKRVARTFNLAADPNLETQPASWLAPLFHVRGVKPTGPGGTWTRRDRIRAAIRSGAVAGALLLIASLATIAEEGMTNGSTSNVVASGVSFIGVIGVVMAAIMAVLHLVESAFAPSTSGEGDGGPR